MDMAGNQKEQNKAMQLFYNELTSYFNHEKGAALVQSVMDGTAVCMYWKDKDLRYRGANSTFLSFYGLSLKKLWGRTAEELKTVSHPKELHEQEKKLLADGEPIRGTQDVEIRGERKHCLYSEAPIRENGEITGLVGFFFDITPMRENEMRLKEETFRDPLTSLRNRRGLAVDEQYLLHKHIFVMIIDVDYFKVFNDSYGHASGDVVLTTVTERIRRIYGAGHCYRIGGDEFLVIGSYVSDYDIRRKDEVLRRKLENVHVFERVFPIHISCGYVHGIPDTIEDLQEMQETADRNLYVVKKNGRNGIEGSARNGDVDLLPEFIDELTELPNAAYYRATGDKWLRDHANGSVPAVIYADAYGTHAYNEQYGFEEGDRLLQQSAKILQKLFPDCPIIRHTEDRFVILTTKNREEIRQAINQLNEEINRWSNGFAAGFRVGVYFVTQPFDAITALDRARRTKNYYDLDRTNCVHFYDENVRHFVDNKDYILTNINRAISSHWIEPYYQPNLGLFNNKVISFEALARWKDPERGVLLPEEFVPILEESNLAYRLDLYMLDLVCRDLAEVRAKGGATVPCHLNLTRSDISYPGIHEKINAIVKAYGLTPQYIGFEFSGAALSDNASDHIRRFRQDGYTVILDNFGNDGIPLSLVENIEFDILKLDRSLLQNVGRKTHVVLSAVIDACKRIGILPLMEGVETAQQVEVLRLAGCMIIQGDWVSPPLPKEGPFLIGPEKKPMQLQKPEDAEFYRPLHRVNVLNVTSNHIGAGFRPIQERQTVFLIVVENDRVHIIYENEAARIWEKKQGRYDRTGLEELINDESTRTYREIREFVRPLNRIGDISRYEVYVPDICITMKAQLVSVQKDKKAYLVVGYKFRDVKQVKDLGKIRKAERLYNGGTDIQIEDFDQMPCALLIYRLDEPYEILYANRKTAQLWGCDTVDDLMNYLHGTVYRVIYSDDRIPAWSAMMRGLRGNDGEYYDVSFRIMPKTGGLRWARTSAVRVDSDQGPLVFSMLQEIKEERKVTDSLTGLISQNQFTEQLSSLIRDNRSRKVYEKRAVVFLNIESFRIYNERFGLAAGDELLRRIAEELHKAFPDAILTRQPVDSFCVFTKVDGIEENLTAVRKSLADVRGYEDLVIDAGIYEIPKEETHAGVCMSNAAAACRNIYGNPGKDTAYYDHKLVEKLELENYVASHIDEAIAKRWIKVYYQPVIRVINHELCSAEALARWIDPEHGFLNPGQFITALERSQQIQKLDKYMLRAVCEEHKERLAAGKPVVPVSFNLSRFDFLEGDIVSYVIETVKSYDIPHDMIRIEITESMAATEAERIQKDINRLRAVGFQVWMDDFGSGYSSLNLLKDFDFDETKLDMKFFSTLTEKSRKIISDLVRMVKGIGLETVAEGVDTREKYEFLRDIGCEKIQGWYFGKPQPYDELICHMEEQNIGVEERKYSLLYAKAGHLDFQRDKSLAIVEKEQNWLIFRYLRDDYRKEIVQIGELKPGEPVYGRRFPLTAKTKSSFSAMEAAEKNGKPQSAYLVSDYGYLHLESTFIGRVGGRALFDFTVEMLTPEAPVTRQSKMDALIRNLYQAYVYAGVTDWNDDSVHTIIDNRASQRTATTDFTLSGWLSEGYKEIIAPEDWERYLAFNNEPAIIAHMKDSYAYAEAFRTHDDNGGYSWRKHVIIKVQGRDRQYLYLTCPITTPPIDAAKQ